MVHLALVGSDYRSSSVIASSQRVLNLYSETISPAQAEPETTTYYQTPGLTLLGTAPGGPIRGLYRASNGDLYCASGLGIYYVSPTYTFTLIGSFLLQSGNPICFADNGTTVIVADGSSFPGTGFSFTLRSRNNWAQILDSNWYGANYLDFSDTYFIANMPGTPNFYISDSEAATFTDATDFAGKSAKPDVLVAAVVAKRVVWLIGQTATEVWMNSGGGGLGTTSSGLQVNTFPYELMPGVSIEDGTIATYSIAKADNGVLWLAQSATGGRYVLMGSGYAATRVSTHAVEHMLNTYSKVSDAIAFSYMQKGHTYYVLNFPTADKTWVYDLTERVWSERCWLDTSGNERRHRASYHAYANDFNIVGDWENGNIYKLDESNSTDNGQPIKRLRTFPAVMETDSNNKVSFKSFIAEMDVGQSTNPSDNPMISLSWSDDRGVSFGNPVSQPLGQTGRYRTSIKWNRLGLGRARVFALEWSCNAITALAGCFVEVDKASS